VFAVRKPSRPLTFHASSVYRPAKNAQDQLPVPVAKMEQFLIQSLAFVSVHKLKDFTWCLTSELANRATQNALLAQEILKASVSVANLELISKLVGHPTVSVPTQTLSLIHLESANSATNPVLNVLGLSKQIVHRAQFNLRLTHYWGSAVAMSSIFLMCQVCQLNALCALRLAKLAKDLTQTTA